MKNWFWLGILWILCAELHGQVTHRVSLGGGYQWGLNDPPSVEEEALHHRTVAFETIPLMLGSKLPGGTAFSIGYDLNFNHRFSISSEVFYVNTPTWSMKKDEGDKGYFRWEIAGTSWWWRNSVHINLWKPKRVYHRNRMRNLYGRAGLGISLFKSNMKQVYKAESRRPNPYVIPEIWDAHFVRNIETAIGVGGFLALEAIYPVTDRLELSLGARLEITANPPLDITYEKKILMEEDLLEDRWLRETYRQNHDRSGVRVESYKPFDNYSLQVRFKYVFG